jgi:ABC-type dipeptide/oligopeptide/nickel transport system permease component
VVQAAVLLLAVFFLFVNLVVDFVYTLLNPRVELV